MSPANSGGTFGAGGGKSHSLVARDPPAAAGRLFPIERPTQILADPGAGLPELPGVRVQAGDDPSSGAAELHGQRRGWHLLCQAAEKVSQ